MMSMLGWLTLMLLGSFFLLMLNWRHSANAIYLLLAVISIVAWIFQRMTVGPLSTPRVPPYLIASFLIYPIAVFLQSGVLGNWSFRAWDTPSRFVLAIPILLFIASLAHQYLKYVFHAAVLGAWWALIGGILQIPTSLDGRAMTYFMHPTAFGNLILIMGLCSLGAYRESWYQRCWAVSGLLAGLCGAYLSGTRAAWMAAGVVALLGVVLQTHISKKMKYGLITVLLLVGVAVYSASSTVRERVNVGWYELTQPLSEVADTSVGLRRQYWLASFQMISDHPIWGVGRFQFPKEKQVLVEAGVLTSAASQYDHPHNELLFAWVELGLLGFIGILCLYLGPAYFFWTHRQVGSASTRWMATIGLMVVGSYIIFGLVDVMIVAWVMQAPVYLLSVMMPIVFILSKQRS
jgi:O-antigen ligase